MSVNTAGSRLTVQQDGDMMRVVDEEGKEAPVPPAVRVVGVPGRQHTACRASRLEQGSVLESFKAWFKCGREMIFPCDLDGFTLEAVPS